MYQHQRYVSHAQYAGGQPDWQQGHGNTGYSRNGHYQQQKNHGWQQQKGHQRQPHQCQQPYQQQLPPQQLPRQPQQPYQLRQQPQQQVQGPPGVYAAAETVHPGVNTPSSRPMKRTRFDTDKDARPVAVPQQHEQQQPRQHIRWEVDKEAYPVNVNGQQQHKAPQQRPSGKSAASWLDTLSDEVLRFAQHAAPNAQEQQLRQVTLNKFERAVNAALGNHQGVGVQLFGSGRAGLALHSSDIDVMITGLCRPYGANGGYDAEGKREVVTHLRKVQKEAYRSMDVMTVKLIGNARIPVLKLQLRSGLELDASINDTSGVNAASFLQSWQEDFCVLRPLVLVLKSILYQNGLGDVSTGGLGSWSLANMIIANLMAEDAAGGQVDHAGHMLLSFLKRYGADWELDRDAVAVAEGGIVPHSSLASPAGGRFAAPGRLAVKDPLTGREVAGGTHRYADVAYMWAELYQDLQQKGPKAAAARGGEYRVLSALLDCNESLKRSGAQLAGAQAYAGYRGAGNAVGYGGGGNAGGYAQPRDGSRKRDR